MKIGFIITGIVFIIVAILVIIADKVNIFGFLATDNHFVRNVVTIVLAVLGLGLIVFGISKKTRINR